MEQNLTFADLGLSEEILQALEKKGYGYPTRIQAEAIPEFLQWKDVIAKAPTGTGKTFAFGIPMIEHIDAESEDLQGLILAPTRELAIQICDELRGLLTYYKNIRVAVVYGGAKIEGQIKQLKAHPQIVVATPGRLMDHYKRHTISFDKVQTVVLDEADRMLDMGFFDDVTKIIEKVKNRRNLGLFSATISQEVMTVSWMYQRDEVEITVRGKSCHGAYPESGVDAIVIAAQVVTALQTMVSRTISPLDSAVLTLGTVQGGKACNIICGEVRMTGTLRTLSDKTRVMLKERIAQLASGVAQGMGGDAEVVITPGYGAVYNDDALYARMEPLAAELLGEDKIVRREMPSLGVESFGYFQKDTPGVYYDLGSGVGTALHTSTFRVDEDCLLPGVAMQCATVLELLKT